MSMRPEPQEGSIVQCLKMVVHECVASVAADDESWLLSLDVPLVWLLYGSRWHTKPKCIVVKAFICFWHIKSEKPLLQQVIFKVCFTYQIDGLFLNNYHK